MLTRFQRWGNSLGPRIPKKAPPKKYPLGDVLKGVTKRKLHGEVPSGAPLGREAW